MDRTSLIFCVVSLAGSLLVALLLFPFATISEEKLRASQTVTAAYEMEAVDLGEFGRVDVQELVDYYIDNPPVKTTTEAPVRAVRFQGC